MHISRLSIENFRNFKHLDVSLGEKTVVVGENNVGKSNLFFALRLLFDPGLPDIARQLRVEDFWDGYSDPVKSKITIKVVAELQGFEDNVRALAVLQRYLVPGTAEPTARFTYVFRARALLASGEPSSLNDYEFRVFGGVDEANGPCHDVRKWLPLDLLPALRDAESDLSSWRRSPLRPLIQRLQVDDESLRAIADAIDTATEELKAQADVQVLEKAIESRLRTMIGGMSSLAPSLGFTSTNPDRLLRELDMFVDGAAKRPIEEMSLGFLNVLYLLLLSLELERKEEKQRTREYAPRNRRARSASASLMFKDCSSETSFGVSLPLLLTTHSPHIASVTPLPSILLLRRDRADAHSVGNSAAGVPLTQQEIADLERYLDATRAEMLFARGIIFVEGAAEVFLVPEIAAQMGVHLDEHGITVCSVHGTDFAPYVKLVGADGLAIPHVVVTDGDCFDDDAGKHQSRGLRRAIRIAAHHGTPEDELTDLYDDGEWTSLRLRLGEASCFVGTSTLELDLIDAGLLPEVREALSDLGAPEPLLQDLDEAIRTGSALHPDGRVRLMRVLGRLGKGRFAQRLAATVDARQAPAYIRDAITRISHLVEA